MTVKIYKEVEVEIDIEDEFYNLSTSDQKKIINNAGSWRDFFDEDEVLNDIEVNTMLEKLSDNDLKEELAKRSLLWRELNE